jgi:hypothetical protein
MPPAVRGGDRLLEVPPRPPSPAGTLAALYLAGP